MITTYIQLYWRHSHDSRETFARVSHDCRETFVRASHDCESFARVTHDSREIFVWASHDSRETFVRVSNDFHANFNQFYFSQLSLEMVLFMSNICRIVQIAETSLRWVCERLLRVGDGSATYAMTWRRFCDDFCRTKKYYMFKTLANGSSVARAHTHLHTKIKSKTTPKNNNKKPSPSCSFASW